MSKEGTAKTAADNYCAGWDFEDKGILTEAFLAGAKWASQSPAAGVRPVVRWFAEQMELQLQKNDHKTGWINDDADELHDRLIEESEELLNEISTFYKNKSLIVKEAADVANFAMMIADVCSNKIGHKKSESSGQEQGQAAEVERLKALLKDEFYYSIRETVPEGGFAEAWERYKIENNI